LKKVKPAEFYFVATLTYIVFYVMIQVGWIYSTTVPASVAMSTRGYASDVHSTGIARSIMKFEDFDIRNSASLFTTHFCGYPTSYYSIIAAIHCLVCKETSYLHMRLINMFLNTLLLLLTFRFAQKIFSPREGFYSCLILSLYPQFYTYFNVATPHLFLTLLVFLSFYFLYRCDYFQKRAYSILFALTSGASLFVKQEALLFLALPSLFVAIRTIAKKDKRRMCNLIIAAAFFLILFIPFLNNFIAPRFDNLVYRLNFTRDDYNVDRSLFDFVSLTFYVSSLFKYQLHPFFATLFFISNTILFNGGKKWKGRVHAVHALTDHYFGLCSC
ncbi:MAG: glycosyltransferase family 39 protein, partial [Candidatus Omnitrophota bacterium]